jgi:hypothetical protein
VCTHTLTGHTQHGSTALIEAVRGFGSADVVRLLLERGADDTKKDNEHQKTAMAWAREKNRQDVIDALENTPPSLSPFLADLFMRAGICSGKQQRDYSRILTAEGMDRAEILVRVTMESLKITGMRLVDAVAIQDAAKAMLSEEDVPLAEAVLAGTIVS